MIPADDAILSDPAPGSKRLYQSHDIEAAEIVWDRNPRNPHRVRQVEINLLGYARCKDAYHPRINRPSSRLPDARWERKAVRPKISDLLGQPIDRSVPRLGF